MLVVVDAAEAPERIWLQRYSSRRLSIDDTDYRLVYGDKRIPLSFDVTLDRFRIGHYPGTQRPRSFESSVTFLDPTTGRQQSAVISMNHPAKHGDYTFFQSSYREDTTQSRTISFLSVSWDPGQPIAFAGYSGMFLGMVWVAATRLLDRRKRGREADDLAGSAVGDSS